MAPTFRLDGACVSSDARTNPVTTRAVKLDYTSKPHARCDSPSGPCYGCNTAEVKVGQEDIHQDAKVA